MNILVTMPGKFGDILWSLPTVRAISQTYNTPVDFVLSKETPSLLPLLNLQPYIGEAWKVEPWYDHQTEIGMQIRPVNWPVLAEYDRVFHLSYRGWPAEPLPVAIYHTAERAYTSSEGELARLDLDTPWITVEGPSAPCELAVGFSDEWFELKVGLVTLLDELYPHLVLAPEGSRWHRERPTGSYPLVRCDWVEAAKVIRDSDRVLACCSALHVLACGLGKAVVMVEPNSARHNPIFYPYGKTGRVHLVCGNDGQPTFDARHVREALLSTREQRDPREQKL